MPPFDFVRLADSDRAYFESGATLEVTLDLPADTSPRPWKDVAEELGWPIPRHEDFPRLVLDPDSALPRPTGPNYREGVYVCGRQTFNAVIREAEARAQARAEQLLEQARARLRDHAPTAESGERAPTSAGAPGASPEPVTTWAQVAQAVGVSLDTLARRRKAWDVRDTKPWFADADAARAWYRRSLNGPPPAATAAPARRAPRPKGTTGGTTLDDIRRPR